MKRVFRLVAFLEGMSYLLLLFVAVPIKYQMGDPTYVQMLGMPHGLFFMDYDSIYDMCFRKKAFICSGRA